MSIFWIPLYTESAPSPSPPWAAISTNINNFLIGICKHEEDGQFTSFQVPRLYTKDKQRGETRLDFQHCHQRTKNNTNCWKIVSTQKVERERSPPHQGLLQHNQYPLCQIHWGLQEPARLNKLRQIRNISIDTSTCITTMYQSSNATWELQIASSSKCEK